VISLYRAAGFIRRPIIPCCLGLNYINHHHCRVNDFYFKPGLFNFDLKSLIKHIRTSSVKSETFLELRLDLIGSDRRDLQLSVWVEFSKKEKVSKDSI